MRKQHEILEKIKSESDEGSGRDTQGKIRGLLIQYLDFENSAPYRSKELKRRDWTQAEQSDEALRDQVQSYLTFAVEMSKAINANDDRFPELALHHFHTLAWLAGKDDLAESLFTPQGNGVEQYKQVCEAFGLNWEDHKEGFKK